MRSKQQTPFESGIISMSGYLAAISKDTESINKLIQNHFTPFSGKSNTKQNKDSLGVFNSIRKYQGIGNQILRNIELYTFGSLDVLIDISDKLSRIYSKFNQKTPNSKQQNTGNTPNSFNELIQNIENLNTNLSDTTKSVETLSNLKTSGFAKLLDNLFSKKSIQGLTKFVHGFKTLNKELSVTEKYLPVLKSIQNFNGKLVIQEKRSMKLPFLASIGFGVAVLATGLILTNYVNWSSVFKISTFILSLGAALGIFMKLGGSGSKIDTSTLKSSFVGLYKHDMNMSRGADLLYSIGIGILIISGALLMLKGVDWKLTAALGGFIIGLTLSLTLYTVVANKKLSTGKRAMSPMFAISFGLALLVLTIAAAGEISWNGVLPLLTFIVGLGFALMLMNKLSNTGSGKNKMVFGGMSGSGFIGFAIGLAIMSLTIEAFNEVSWKGALTLIGFVIALGFAMGISQGKNGGGFKGSGMFGFAIGLAIIILTIDAMDEINWVSALKLIGFITGLGLALRTYDISKNNKGVLASISIGLLMFAGTLWLINKMNIDTIQIIGLLGLIIITGWAINEFNRLLDTKQAGMFLGTSLIVSVGLFVLSIGLTTASIAGLTSGFGVPLFIVSTLTLLYGVLLPLSNITTEKSNQFLVTALLLSVGLVLLSVGLSIASGIGNTLGSGLIKFGIGTIGMIGLVFAVSKLRNADLLKFLFAGLSISLGLIILSIGLFTASNIGTAISIGGFTKVLVGAGIAVAVLLIFSKISIVSAGKFILVSAAMGIGLFLLSYSVNLISNTNVNLANIGWFVLSVTIFTGMFFLLGMAIPVITVGIVGVVMMGVGLLVIRHAIDTINNMEFQRGKITTLSEGIIGICLMFAKVALYAIPALIGAVLITPLLAISVVAAGLLMVISMISVSSENLLGFKTGIYSIVSAYNQFGVVEAGKTLTKAVMITPVILLAVVSAGILSVISRIEISERRNLGFKLGVGIVVSAFNQFGLVEAGKAGLKATALLPVMLAGLAAAFIMEKISKTELSTAKMETFASNIDLLVDTMVAAVNRSQSKLEEAGPGIEALVKLTSIGTNLVDIMIAMANGTYTEYAVKDGKIVPIAVKQINYKDLSSRIGNSFAILIQALTDSLNAIDDSKDTWTIGGISISNPFSKNKSRLETIEKLGTSFLPLVEIIKGVSSIELFQNKTFMNNFNNGLGIVISNIVLSMQKLNDTEFNNIDANITRLGLLTTNIDKFQKLQFDKSNNGISVFMDNLSDEGRWNRIATNIDKTGTSISKIVKTINGIDLQKAKTLEKTLQHMAEKNDSNNLIKVLNKVCDMIGSLRITQDEGLQKIKDILETGIVPEMRNSGNNYRNAEGDTRTNNSGVISEIFSPNKQTQKTDAEMLRERAIPVIIVNSSSEPIPVDDIENGIGKSLGAWNSNLTGGLK